jgi:hypothetical protein
MLGRVEVQWAAALLTALVAVSTVESASAGISRWVCQGKIGDERILFGDGELFIASGKASAGKAGKATAQSILDAFFAAKNGGGFTRFVLDVSDRPLAITFSQTDSNKQTQKVVLFKQSSKQLWRRHKRICRRYENTTLFRTVYRYERDGEPARDLTMMCVEYEFTTNGGRQDCG